MSSEFDAVPASDFGELPLWDRLFGTYQDAPAFAPRCGLARDT